MSKLDTSLDSYQQENVRDIHLSNIQINDIKITKDIIQINQQTLPIKVDEFLIPIKNGADISVIVYQDKIGSYPDTTYTKKRYTGHCPILLEGSKDTRITYKVTGLSQDQINQVNSLDTYDIKGRLDLIEDFNGSVQFHSIKHFFYRINIAEIDGWMDKILAHSLIYFYKDNKRVCLDIVKHLHEKNPLRYPGQKTYYVRYRKILSALVCGWDLNRRWKEYYPIYDCYQAPYENGDMYSYHIPDRIVFQDMLLLNTKFDKPDPILCDYGHIYSEQGESLLDLALQIRFTKE